MVIPTETVVIMTPVLGGIILYFIRLESRLTKIITDLCWIKKALSSRSPERKEEDK